MPAEHDYTLLTCRGCGHRRHAAEQLTALLVADVARHFPTVDTDFHALTEALGRRVDSAMEELRHNIAADFIAYLQR